MALQNFVSKVGPAISAAWLNAVDRLKFTVFDDAVTKPAARVALTLDGPLEVLNGGTGNRGTGTQFTDWLASFFPSIYQYINPQTAAESSASVVPTNYAYRELDIRRYGADPTGVADSGTAVASAIAVLVATSPTGGKILLPSGLFSFAGSINCDQKYSILFEGQAGYAPSGHHQGTILLYTGTGGTSFISARSAFNICFRNLQINFNNAGFTGFLIDYSHVTSTDGSFHFVESCQINSYNGLLTNGNGINFDKCNTSVVSRCNFDGMNNAITGQNAAGNTYSNSITIEKCRFGNIFDLPILGVGNVWSIIGNTFEQRQTGAAGACFNSQLTPALGVTYLGNYHADATAGAGTWVSLWGEGFKFSGNFFVGPTASPVGTAIQLHCDGAEVSGNYFERFLTAIVFGSATLTLTGGPSGGATSATLTAAFTGNTGFYAYTFSNGDVRYIKLTLGATTATWTTALSGAASTTITQNCYNFEESGNTIVNCTNRYGSTANQLSFALGAQGYNSLPNNRLRMRGSVAVTAGTPVAVTFLSNNGRTFAAAPEEFNINLYTPGTVTNTVYFTSLTATGVTLNVNGTGANTVYWSAEGLANMAN